MKIGRFQIDFLLDGLYLVDGGALFGTTPASDWTADFPPDANNRVLLRIRCMLVRDGKHTLLVDTGMGNQPGKKLSRTKIDLQPHSENLPEHLQQLGVPREHITHVIHTHLHTPHCGWSVTATERTKARLYFPNADYWVQKKEWEQALNPHPMAKRYYNPFMLEGLAKSGNLHFAEGDTEVIPGVFLECTGTHSGTDQIVRISDQGETLVFLGDFIPTTGHMSPLVIAASDFYPVLAFEKKTVFLAQARKLKWKLCFAHDPFCRVGILATDEKSDLRIKCLEKEPLKSYDGF